MRWVFNDLKLIFRLDLMPGFINIIHANADNTDDTPQQDAQKSFLIDTGRTDYD